MIELLKYSFSLILCIVLYYLIIAIVVTIRGYSNKKKVKLNG